MTPGILLGLAAAISWGAADFFARYSSKRIGAYRTLFFMTVAGLLSASLYLAYTRESVAALARAAAAHAGIAVFLGLMSSASMVAFYTALEKGTLSLVAPIASSYPALTVLLAYASGERLTRLRLLGIALTLCGVVLASMGEVAADAASGSAPARPKMDPGVWLAIASSAGFGVTYWALAFYAIPAWGGIGTVWIQRLSSLVWLAAAARPLGRSLALPVGSGWWLVVIVGILDALGFLLSNLGFQREQVGVVTVLGSLFGAVTLLLAFVFLGERLHRRQWIGVALIFTGILLINSV
ncbi:MAG TPA: DMT family transporter [Candidatus Acidoferrales bacterium]|nr:DMT family transporter [Candidatus Acidoferrales bacterium]